MKWLEAILFDLIEDMKNGTFGTYQEQVKHWQALDRVEPILAQCILSSGWRYEKAEVAGHSFSAEICEKYRSGGIIPLSVIIQFLTSKDVRHRFPNRRAEQLKASFEKLWEISDEHQLDFSSYDCKYKLRNFLIESFPGLGLKQASMFLRDAGFTYDLAIIDTHVIWYFENVRGQKICSQNKTRYLNAERTISQFCNENGVPTGLIDILIWNLVKCYKQQVGNQKCKKRYAFPLEASTHQLASTY